MRIKSTILNIKLLSAITIALMIFSMDALSYADTDAPQTVPHHTENQEPTIVKVGITEFPFFSEKQPDGSYQGIICDYLKEIAKYTGWKIEYVEGSPEDLTQYLLDGDIDMSGGMLKNEYTVTNFNMAEYNSGYSYSTLTVKKDNFNYIPMDYSSFEDIKIGIFNQALNRIASLNSFCTSNGINFIPVFYDNPDHLILALENGEVDAILSNDSSLKDNQKIIAKFASIPYYFATTKAKPELLSELNSTLYNLIEINPKFDNMLYEKYFENSSPNRFIPTAAEKEYIKHSPPLRVVGFPDWAPVQYINREGTLSGISISTLDQLSSITGLKFEYIHAASYQDAVRLIKENQADMITGIYDNLLLDNNNDITLTQSLMTTQTIMAKHINSPQNSLVTIALPDGMNYSLIPADSQITYYSNVEECLKAVIAGNADYTIANSLVINHYMQLRGSNKLTLVPISQTMGELCIGLSKPTNPTLLSILDKAIYCISQDDIQASVFKHASSDNYDISLDYFVYSNPKQFALIIFGICMIFMVAVFLIMRMRLRLSQQTALNSEAYRIIGELTNEYIFEFDFESKELRLPTEFSKLIGHRNSVFRGTSKKKYDASLQKLISMFETDDLNVRSTTEFKCRLSNGHEEWFRAIGTVLFSSQKKPTRGIGKIVNIQAEMEEKKELENKACRDDLTGLYNKQYCADYICDFFSQGFSTQKGALLLIDLDYFKQVNDTLGHLAGDQVLQELSSALSLKFFGEDVVGRWGGDEFIVFIGNITDEEALIERVDSLCKHMNKLFQYDGKNHILSISVGMAYTNAASSYDQLFKDADAALYAVKKGLRNGFTIYSEFE